MKIAFIDEQYRLGGSSKFVYDFCLAAQKLENIEAVAFSITRQGSIGVWLEKINCYQGAVDAEKKIYEDRLYNLYFLLKEYNPDIVVANISAISFEIFRYLPEGIIKVGMIHSDHQESYNLLSKYEEDLDYVFCVSRHCEKTYKEQYSKVSTKVFCQHCGIDFNFDINRINFDRFNKIKKLSAIYVGRLTDDAKRISWLIDIIQSTSTLINWHLIGDGPMLSRVQEVFRSLDNVKVYGRCDQEQIREIMKDMHIFFLCSDYEGLPLSLLEAMSMGVVPVVSDLKSGIREVVNVNNGYLVDYTQKNAYIETLNFILKNKDELMLRSRRSLESFLEEYTAEKMVLRWKLFFESYEKKTDLCWNANVNISKPKGSRLISKFSIPKFMRRALKK